MNLGNDFFFLMYIIMASLFNFFLCQVLSQIRAELSKDNRVIYSKFSSTASSSTLNLNMTRNVCFGHLRGKDGGILKSVDHFSELCGHCQHSDVDLLLFPRRIFESL